MCLISISIYDLLPLLSVFFVIFCLQLLTMKPVIVLMLFITVNIGVVSTARILLLPWTHYSHVNHFIMVGASLKNSSHDVTILVDKDNVKPATRAGLTPLLFAHSYEDELDAAMTSSAQVNSWFMGKNSLFSAILNMTHIFNSICRDLLEDFDVMETIETSKFDLSINDLSPYMTCMYAINYKYDIPYISIGDTVDPWAAGVSASPANEVHPWLGHYELFSFSNRLRNFALSVFQNTIAPILTVNNDFIQEYVSEKPVTTFRKLITKSEMFLITRDVTCFEFPRVSAPNYRYIGSLSAAQPIHPLSLLLEEFAATADEGLILVSFGYIHHKRPVLRPHISKLMGALAKLKQKVFLQFMLADFRGLKIPDNMRVSSWFPQNDILAHNKTVLFITHGGVNSHLEATYHGIPTLTLTSPFQPEHMGNAIRAESKQHGRVLNLKVSSTTMYNTFTEMVTNPKYKKHVRKCSKIMKSLPDPKDELVYWTDHILQYGGSHLQPASSGMGTMQFFMMDIVLFLVTLTTFALVLCYILCIKIFRKMCNSLSTGNKFKTE